MITALLDLVDPSAFKRFDVVVISAAVDAIKQLELDVQFDISFFKIVRLPDDPNTSVFIAQIHKNTDTGGAYIGNVHYSTDRRQAVFEAKEGCTLKRRNAIKGDQAAAEFRARRSTKRSL